ncbi:hypothetical protein AYO42_00610 [Rhizomicrobium sp. SCGC AG-212-E05]|nr:hypothetical protein AYO42_00610 [Rhizomicrobium sp. SCGC AG-212-E05]
MRHALANRLKALVYAKSGEPYVINGHTLRYLAGTRPVRLRYLSSTNRNTRYDALQVKWFADNLKEGDTAIDIGAHYGVYSILMAAMCGKSGTVVSFEPDPYAREVLERNLALNPDLKRPIVESIACSDAPGEATLFSRGGNAQSSLVRSAVEFAPEHTSEQFTVPLVTLDSYIAEKKLATPRWVKIDPEGAEIRILKGAPKLLASDAGILCELHPYAWPEFGNTFAELKDIVSASGRRIRYIDEENEVGDAAIYGTVLLEKR